MEVPSDHRNIQRPLLKTRRFWFGLAGFLLLTGFITSSRSFQAALLRNSPLPRLSEHGDPMVAQRMLMVAEGSIGYTYTEFPYWSTRIPTTRWRTKWVKTESHFRWLPERLAVGMSGIFSSGFVMPLWPLPLLWLVLWITSMIRANRRERKLLSQL